jgi:integrase
LIDLKKTKSSLNDYASIIERYFVPYFGERQIETLTHSDVREFEQWRDIEWHTDKGISDLLAF